MKKISLLIFIAVVSAFAMSSQGMHEAARWTMSVKMTSATDGVVTLKANVNQGWHIYGTDLPKGGPKPTVIDFSGSVGVRFISETVPSIKPVSKVDKMFNLPLTWWDSSVKFSRKFKVVRKDNARINASVTFMGCNDETCLPPKTVKLSREIKK